MDIVRRGNERKLISKDRKWREKETEKVQWKSGLRSLREKVKREMEMLRDDV